MIRLKANGIYVLTSYHLEDARKAFMKLYRKYRKVSIMITPNTSQKWLFRYRVRNILENNVGNVLDAVDMVSEVIHDVIEKIMSKEYVKKWIKHPNRLLSPFTWQGELLSLIGSAMLRRKWLNILIDRPEAHMMPVEQVAFSKAIAAMHRRFKNGTVSLVILTTSSYLLMLGTARVYFVSYDGKKLRFERKPLRAFAVADLML